MTRRRADAIRIGAPVHRSRGRGAAGVCGDGEERAGDRRDLPHARRHSAGARARRGARARAPGGSDRHAPVGSLSPADGRRQDVAPAPADAARVHRLELRPALATEQGMLRRLAVFAGGWTLEAAERVGADPIVDVFEVVDLLTNLVEKSLVQLEADGGRYRLLETVRQYAKERLSEAGEKGQTRTRHLAFFVDLAEEATPHLMGPEQGDVARAARPRAREPPRRALVVRPRRARRRARAAPAVRRARLLDHPRSRRAGAARDGGGAGSPGREGAQPAPVPGARCGSVSRLFHGPLRGGEGLRGREPFDRARNRGQGPDRRGADVAGRGGARAGQSGRRARGISRSRSRSRGSSATRCGSSRRSPCLAELYRVEGDLDAAEPLYEESLALNRKQGVGSNIAVNLLNIAMVSIGRGAGDRAREILLEALAIAEKIRSKAAGRAALDVAVGPRGAARATGSAPRGYTARRRRSSSRPGSIAKPRTRRSSRR